MSDNDCMNHQTIFRSNLISSSWCQLLCMSSRWGFSSQFTHLSEELTWLLTRQRRQKIHYVENKEIIACGWMSPFRVTFSITFLVSFLLMLPKLDQLFLQYASMISWLLFIDCEYNNINVFYLLVYRKFSFHNFQIYFINQIIVRQMHDWVIASRSLHTNPIFYFICNLTDSKNQVKPLWNGQCYCNFVHRVWLIFPKLWLV